MKLFKIHGSFNESKVMFELSLNETSKTTTASVYITSDNIKIEGYVAFSNRNSICIRNIQDETNKSYYEDILDEIIGLKLISFQSKLYVIAVCRDGKFSVIETEFMV